MSWPKDSIPKYSVSKTGRAFTKVSGQFVSLGTDSPVAKLKYAGILEKLACGHSLESAKAPAKPNAAPDMTEFWIT